MKKKQNQTFSNAQSKRKPQKHVAILGAGAGGTATAIELARRGFLVDLFDKNSDILLGSSNATPGRAGHGFHYIHAETGILYLDATLEIVKEFPGCLLGAGRAEDHFLRHGLYFIMKEAKDLAAEDHEFASLFPVQNILDTYSQLKTAYQEKIASDPELCFFGDPEQFYRIANLADFAEVVDISKVAVVVDTREELLNWPLVREKLCHQVNIHPNIAVHKKSYVKNAHYDANTHGFVIETNKKKYNVDYVINATWENVEYLSNRMGFHVQHENRTVRLKCIIKVILPDLLKHKSSMFFCMGAHCMFSNMGDGTAMVTYAPITNIRSSTDIKISAEIQSFLNGEASTIKKMALAKKILDGISKYIPVMADATIRDVGFGIIKTIGDVDIFDPNSRFHHRDYLGVTPRQIGWVDNSCMKLLYFSCNARLTASILEQHEIANEYIFQIKEHLCPEREKKGFKDIAEMIVVNLQRRYESDTIVKQHIVMGDVMADVMSNKIKLHQEFQQSRRSAIYYGLQQGLRLSHAASSPHRKIIALLVLVAAILMAFKFYTDSDIIYPSVRFWMAGENLEAQSDSSSFSTERSGCQVRNSF